MGKVEKIILCRIILTAFLLMLSIFTDIFNLLELPAHIIIFFIISYDIVWNAILNIKKGQHKTQYLSNEESKSNIKINLTLN